MEGLFFLREMLSHVLFFDRELLLESFHQLWELFVVDLVSLSHLFLQLYLERVTQLDQDVNVSLWKRLLVIISPADSVAFFSEKLPTVADFLLPPLQCFPTHCTQTHSSSVLSGNKSLVNFHMISGKKIIWSNRTKKMDKLTNATVIWFLFSFSFFTCL